MQFKHPPTSDLVRFVVVPIGEDIDASGTYSVLIHLGAGQRWPPRSRFASRLSGGAEAETAEDIGGGRRGGRSHRLEPRERLGSERLRAVVARLEHAGIEPEARRRERPDSWFVG
jgi:hypothetical protein